jgi:hypothetical protein
MRVFVVKSETNADDVRRRLLKPGVSAARAKTLEDSVRAANPHVDLDALRPGTVLIVPDHPDLAPDDSGSTALGGAGLSVDQLTAALPRVAAVVERGAEAARQRGEDLRKALDAREVRRATETDERLRAEVDRLAEVVADEQRRAEAWAAAVRAQSDQWRAALNNLKQLG